MIENAEPESPAVEQAVAHFLATGESDPFGTSFPGRHALERIRACESVLRDALVKAVQQRARGREHTHTPPNTNSTAWVRRKVAPMIHGLFRADERETMLATVERSIVFLTCESIERIVREAAYLETAWTLANMFLSSLRAPRLSDNVAPVGLSVETTCYVSLEYFAEDDPFADYVVHEVAHIFHNCKRRTLGLPYSRTKEWLLDIAFAKRETFAYACEIYSRILEQTHGRAERVALLAQYASSANPVDHRVDQAELRGVLADAVEARNGWKRILAGCAASKTRLSRNAALQVPTDTTVSSKWTSSPDSLGAKLRAALTDQQIQTLLHVAAETGQLRAIEDRLQEADPDLADTVRRILDNPDPQASAVPSSQKTVQVWASLWKSWEKHIADVADEEGPYANHKEHWHPPYLDHGALEKDLEEDANRLLEWIEQAFPLIEEPNLFLDSLQELNENMRSLPEWFQPVDDDFVLGPSATSCVLRWTWLGLANQSQPGHRLTDAVRKLEQPGKHTELTRDAACQFFSNLPEDVCCEIHDYLRDPSFREMLADRRSLWHRIQHGYESRFDPAAHLRTCEEHLHQDWRYGEPLIDDALARPDDVAAEEFIELTLSSLLRWSGDAPWRPETMLLPESRYYRPPEESEAMLRLLNTWESTAARCGKRGRVASLRLQGTILRSPEDWAEVLGAFREYETDPTNRAVAERLFIEWRQRVASACASQEGRNEQATDSWVHCLIDAQRNPLSDQDSFLKHLDVWLERCRKHASFFQENWRSLALLTLHLPRHNDFKAKCATFHSDVLVPALQISTIWGRV